VKEIRLPAWALALAITWVAAALAFGPAVAESRHSGADACDIAARYAAGMTGVPLGVLKALSRTETGRKIDGQFRPWAWTVNMEGKGRWFPDRKSALTFAKKNYDRGARSFDVGCFQINFKWHGRNFSTLNQMFEPRINALYAARFLQKLYQNKHDWAAAAGAYHSKTPRYAKRYMRRFADLWKEAEPGHRPIETAAAEPQPKARRPNRYPFFVVAADSERSAGSLVALSVAHGTSALITPLRGSLF